MDIFKDHRLVMHHIAREWKITPEPINTHSRAFIKAEVMLHVVVNGKYCRGSKMTPCRIDASTGKLDKLTAVTATIDGFDPVLCVYVRGRDVAQIKVKREWCHRGQ